MSKQQFNLKKSKKAAKKQSGIRKAMHTVATKMFHIVAPLMIMVAVILGKKVKGKLGFPNNISDGNLVNRARAIFDAITANIGGFYTAIPFAQLAQLGTLIAQFDQDRANVKNRILGAEEAKLLTRSQLLMVLDLALVWINQLAFFDQDHAGLIITGAGMQIITRSPFDKPDFYVRQGAVTGVAVLRAKAPKNGANKYMRTTYFWEYSLDNGVTWITLPSTHKAKLVAIGMNINMLLLFRKRVYTSDGLSAWCTPVSITLV